MVGTAASRYWGPDLASAELSLMMGILVLCPSWVQDNAEQSAQHVRNRSRRLYLLRSSAEEHKVIHDEVARQVSGVTPVAVVAEVGHDPLWWWGCNS
jgi:hypothetical protein